MFSSKTDQWATPQKFFDELAKEFNFTLDVCADQYNTKCKEFYNTEQNGLAQSWVTHGCVWCNPPYGRNTTPAWVKKAYEVNAEQHQQIVMLLPARTDTRWFHDYIYHKAEIRFIKGRLKFGDSKSAAPFPSMLIIFN